MTKSVYHCGARQHSIPEMDHGLVTPDEVDTVFLAESTTSYVVVLTVPG